MVIGIWVAIAAIVIGLSSSVGRELKDSFAVPGLDSQKATDLLSAAESEQAGLTAQVVISPLDESVTFFDSQESRDAVAEIQAGLVTLPNVLGTSDTAAALTGDHAEAVASGLVSADGRVAIITLQYPVLEELTQSDLEALKHFRVTSTAASVMQIEMGGDLFSALEEGDTGIGEIIGLIAAVIILLVAFGSLIAMGLPIIVALFGIILGISAMSLITYVVEIPSFAPEMGSMIGIGIGIDYALFLVSRHREYLQRGMTVEESAGRAVATAGQAVLFAGGTVVIAILGLAFVGIPFLTAAGISTSFIVLIMVLASLTLVPALLGLSGGWINRLGLPFLKSQRQTRAVKSNWERWGYHVSKNAWPYAIGGTVLLLALTAPILTLEVGYADGGTLSETRTERRAYDLVAESFGPGINGPLIIAIDISRDASIVDPLAEAIAADPGIASIAAPQVNLEAGVATITAFPTTSPQDTRTLETVDRLRAEVFPVVLRDSPALAHVGGMTANFGDLGNKVYDRMPFFIAAVILLSFVLLMVVFRSVVVPLKAALLNLLSIGTAYGVLVIVFQWGWGIGLLGLESTIPIIPFIPVFMFAALFGLSMDYEVFLLYRVREEYLLTGDNTGAVVQGISKTGRVITSAALIMIAVFLGFLTSSDPLLKMLGLGLATAILVDVTIVRMVLVPATMTLMGKANWWLPGWLDRILPTIDIEGEAGLPEPEFEPGHTRERRTVEAYA